MKLSSALFVSIVVALLPLVGCYAHFEGALERTIGPYRIQFASDPKFPTAGQQVSLLFSVQNVSTGRDLANIRINLLVSGKQGRLLEIKEASFKEGDVAIPYMFPRSGAHTVLLQVLTPKGQVEAEFPVEVSGGKEGETNYLLPAASSAIGFVLGYVYARRKHPR